MDATFLRNVVNHTQRRGVISKKTCVFIIRTLRGLSSFLAPNILLKQFLFGGEGPRSRSYGRTAALRLIVQPCDEYNYFFPCNGITVE